MISREPPSRRHPYSPLTAQGRKIILYDLKTPQKQSTSLLATRERRPGRDRPATAGLKRWVAVSAMVGRPVFAFRVWKLGLR